MREMKIEDVTLFHLSKNKGKVRQIQMLPRRCNLQTRLHDGAVASQQRCRAAQTNSQTEPGGTFRGDDVIHPDPIKIGMLVKSFL